MSREFPLNAERPMFRGVQLTVNEQKHGLIIRPIFPNEPVKWGTAQFSRNQIWMGRGGRLFLELRFGGPYMETTANRSVLTNDGVRALCADVTKVRSEIAAVEAREEAERELGRMQSYKIVFEKKDLSLPTSTRSKNKAAQNRLIDTKVRIGDSPQAISR